MNPPPANSSFLLVKKDRQSHACLTSSPIIWTSCNVIVYVANCYIRGRFFDSKCIKAFGDWALPGHAWGAYSALQVILAGFKGAASRQERENREETKVGGEVRGCRDHSPLRPIPVSVTVVTDYYRSKYRFFSGMADRGIARA